MAEFLLRLPALLLAMVFHEYAHARVANALGDPTPRAHGRLTLNPIAHVDWIGLAMLWFFRFGWARAVPVNPFNFRNPRSGMALTSLAGPLANVVLAFLALLMLRLGWPAPTSPYFLVVDLFLTYNLALAVFNLIPVPPLDGYRVLGAALPRGAAGALDVLERYGWIILVALVWTGAIGRLMGPLMSGLFGLLDAGARAIAG
ncbi:MAG: site-2 protease family protein [Acetobacteraceae bacterium]|nr:site-2 protease family protein [Acetobacteraceae bacterium]